jgi:hypothetical protein
MTLNEHFLIQNLSNKNIELQLVNKLLFNKVASLKTKLIELESEFEKIQKDIILEFDDFEIIDFVNDK